MEKWDGKQKRISQSFQRLMLKTDVKLKWEYFLKIKKKIKEKKKNKKK